MRMLGHRGRMLDYRGRMLDYRGRTLGHRGRALGHRGRALGHRGRTLGHRARTFDRVPGWGRARIRRGKGRRVGDGRDTGPEDPKTKNKSWNPFSHPPPIRP
jgi:hypothetical protein